MLFDPPPELALEGIVVLELEALCRFCGSKGLARRARVDLLLVCHRAMTLTRRSRSASACFDMVRCMAWGRSTFFTSTVATLTPHGLVC